MDWIAKTKLGIRYRKAFGRERPAAGPGLPGLCSPLTACNACLGPRCRVQGPSGGHKAGKLEGAKEAPVCLVLTHDPLLVAEGICALVPSILAPRASQARQASVRGWGVVGYGWVDHSGFTHFLRLAQISKVIW